MHIVFDMDNTLSDELGKKVRPGIPELLEKLKQDGHRLSVWTSSTRIRALIILKDFGLREYFTTFISREEYDPENKNLPKDIRVYDGDILIDDDPMQIDFTKSIGKKGFLVEPFRADQVMDKKEMEKLYRTIRRAAGLFGLFS